MNPNDAGRLTFLATVVDQGQNGLVPQSSDARVKLT